MRVDVYEMEEPCLRKALMRGGAMKKQTTVEYPLQSLRSFSAAPGQTDAGCTMDKWVFQAQTAWA